MGSFVQKHKIPVLISTLCHIALGAILAIGFDPSSRQRAAMPSNQVAIEATVVDEAWVQQELERLEQLEQAELLRQQNEERQAREQAEQARRERENEERRLEAAREEAAEAARQEELRLTNLRRQREEEEERLRQQEEAEARREAERIAELERQRAEEEQRRRQEAAAAAQRAEMEAELQRALAVEDERRRAQEAGLLDEYILLIENRIQQNWIPPATAIAGLECIVNVTQIPSGDVIDVQVGRCTGDAAVVRSIEAAVLRSSPLPRPPIPSLFERNLEVVFNPGM